MGVASKAYDVSASLGRLDGYFMVCACTVLACFLVAFGAVNMFAVKDERKHPKVVGALLSSVGIVCLLCGIAYAYAVTHHKPLAAVAGVGMVF